MRESQGSRMTEQAGGPRNQALIAVACASFFFPTILGICEIGLDVIGYTSPVPAIVDWLLVLGVPMVTPVVCIGALRAPWGLRVVLMVLLMVLVPIGVLGQLVIIAVISFQVSGLSGLQ